MNVHSIFEPVGVETFLNEYFEKKHLLIKRGDVNFYDSIISLFDIDQVLFSQKLFTPSFRLVNSRTDTYPDTSTYCYKGTNVVNPKKFVQGFTEGNTLAMAGFQHIHHNLRKFCFDMENLFGHPFQTNLYLTPKDSKGFSPHWDSHDVLVLQISGTKYWKIYENGVVLADTQLKFEKKEFDAGKVIDEILLEPGDFLYIPRGLTHDAYTDESHSLHVTTGMLGYTWSQYMIESIVHLSKNDKQFRRFIPLGTMNHEQANYTEQVDELVEKIKEQLLGKSGLKRFSKELIEKQNDCTQNLLTEVMSLDLINAESTVVRRPGVSFSLSQKEDLVLLKSRDTVLEFPSFCQSVIEFISHQTNAFTVSQLPDDLDEEGKLVFVKRLIKEGILITSN
jgi:ribosomal protein L16 Arg81 hydroxylase